MIRRSWRWVVVGLLGAAAILLTVVTREGGDRWVALGLAVPGLLAGAAGAAALDRRRPAGGRAPRRSAAERINDVAFMVVVVAVWALLLALLGPWSGLVTGVLVGAALGLGAARRRPRPGA